MHRRPNLTLAAAPASVTLGALGALAAATLLIAAPGTGTAAAHGLSTPSGDAVGRKGLDNPAPLMRVAQALGDRVFNQSTPLNKALDDSALGVGYHAVLGTPDYAESTHGKNGSFLGILNTPGPAKDAYDAAQAAGMPLPAETDLPGVVVRMLSGVPVTPGNHNDAARTAGSAALGARAGVPKPARGQQRTQGSCSKSSGTTALRAQGSC